MKHVTKIGNNFYFRCTPKMRAAGLSNEPLGDDRTAAYARAVVLNQLWSDIRSSESDNPLKGSFPDLVDQFQKDPVWYGRRATTTKEDMDRAFKSICAEFGSLPVALVETKHVRNFYNRLRVDTTVSVAQKTHKWLRRLFRYSVEIGLREYNPAIDMEVEQAPSREAVWRPAHVEKVISEALSGGVAASGNAIPPRPSIALATRIAYDTAQRQGDILALQWPQYDGEGIEVTQGKTGKKLWLPLTLPTRAMLDGLERTSTHIIVSEKTGQPYTKNTFSRIFRKFRQRAGIEGVHFHDLRRTVASELGNKGATSAEIVSITGHSITSKAIDIYVRPDREAALRAAKKREK